MSIRSPHEKWDGREVVLLQLHTPTSKQSVDVVMDVANEHETHVNLTKELLGNKKGPKLIDKSILVVSRGIIHLNIQNWRKWCHYNWDFGHRSK